MHNKEEALYEFFRSFKITLGLLSLYSKEHPFFKHSAEEFKKRIDALFISSNAIKLAVADNYLLLEGKRLDKVGLHDELARTLHLRKVKSIELRKGVASKELTCLLGAMHLSARQILKEGGFNNFLKREGVKNIYAEELDYSQFLEYGTEECKDIWAYLLKDAIDTKDNYKINGFADNIEKILGNFKAKDLIENNEIKDDILQFLSYLKGNHKEKFYKGAKEITKLLLREKDVYARDKLAQIRVLLQDVQENNFAEAFYEELFCESSLSPLSLNLFSLLLDEDKHKRIAQSLAEKMTGKESLVSDAKITRKLKGLVSSSDTSSISEVYRNVLFGLTKGLSFREGFSFDRDALDNNYRFLLLNLFSDENNPKRLNLVLKRVSQDWEKITRDGASRYLKYLLAVLQEKKKNNPALTPIFLDLDKRISHFIEDNILKEEPVIDIEYFMDNLEKSSAEAKAYINKIFDEDKVNPYILKLFLKFFPQELPLFYERLERRYYDLEFLDRIIKNLKLTGLPQTLGILKRIYAFSNNLIKMEALKAIQELGIIDEKFLLSILNEGDFFLKKKAVSILIKDNALRKQIAKALYLSPGPFSKKNNILLENITLLDEFGLKEASEYLLSLGKNLFSCNRSVRNKAQEVLGKWNVRKS